MTNTDNASGPGMETTCDEAVSALLGTLIEADYSAKQINAAFSKIGYTRRTDASRLLAEKEGELQRLRSALKAIEGADSWLYAINTAHAALKP